MKKILLLLFVAFSVNAFATKLVSFKVLDKDYLMLYFRDGDVEFDESKYNAEANRMVYHGSALNTNNAQNKANWVIKSNDDSNYGASGENPTQVYRKSKICSMSQEGWNTSTDDWDFDNAFEHYIYLKLPKSLQEGKTYTLEINSNTNSDKTSQTLKIDIFNNPSEAIKVNLVGYSDKSSLKAADVYMWMGDGGSRDYSSFIGNKVFVYDVNNGTSTEVGTLEHFANESTETTHKHKMLMSSVWTAVFSSITTPGKYRVAIEGIGCSENFTIANNVYHDPFKLSVLGYFYMRIGEAAPGITPTPRTPLYIPGSSPSNCKVYITEMTPYHPQWSSLSGGDKWDVKEAWDAYVLPGRPENPRAYGGHSDAKDWDRHLSHVSNIYDMLLPFFLSKGAISEDNLGITESGNGIPDIIDEARNEVDFFLRLRYGKGYSHGLNNPTSSNVFYQAGNTPMAAWANAANAAMISNCFMLSGHNDLMAEYRDSAINAFDYASGLSDQMLNTKEGIGSVSMTGNDFRMTAAAHLYNLTGDTKYEDIVKEVSKCTSKTSSVCDGNFNQIYATAAYLFTNQTVNYPTLYENMKASIINEAKNKEASYSSTRPSRRASDNNIGWFQTEIMTQRSIVAHAITDDSNEKQMFEDALISEADWTLGRNPLNMVQMSTATTSMAHLKNAENQYTSGWHDGTDGIHPGHTPYMNVFDWGGSRLMGNPSRLVDQNYPQGWSGSKNPSGLLWPMGELYYNTRYLYAANEFTPRQTMRGKMALYGYLYSLSGSCDRPNLGKDQTICGKSEIILNANISGATISWEKDGMPIAGTAATLKITEAGEYTVTTDIDGCMGTDAINILNTIPAIDLGEDISLCSPSSAVVSVEANDALDFTWQKDGVDIPYETSNEYTVTKAGVYSLIVDAENCDAVSDDVIVTSKLLKAQDATICAPGDITLSVTDEGGIYSWYDSETGGSPIETGAEFTTAISQNNIYYVEDASGSAERLGPESPTAYSDSIWGTWADGFQYKVKFEVLNNLTFKSVTVYNRDANNITCRILASDQTTIIKKVTVPAVDDANLIELNVELEPGTYYIDPYGTDGNISLNGNNTKDGVVQNPPFTDFSGDALAFAGTEPAWIGNSNRWWLYFYDWVVATGNVCDRTPVTATIGGSADCGGITQTIELAKGWNMISTNVQPADNSIKTIFAGLDVEIIKTFDTFWKASQEDYLNSIDKITAGQGYLVYMNTAGTLSITGIPITTDNYYNLSEGWNLIGCPYQTAEEINTIFNTSDIQVIKDFEDFWQSGNTLNSLEQLQPGKAYYLKK